MEISRIGTGFLGSGGGVSPHRSASADIKLDLDNVITKALEGSDVEAKRDAMTAAGEVPPPNGPVVNFELRAFVHPSRGLIIEKYLPEMRVDKTHETDKPDACTRWP